MAKWNQSETASLSESFEEMNALPASAFTDPDVFEDELENVFTESWQYVGSSNQLESPGDYLTADVAGRSVVVIRDDDGELQAYDNVCPHRGSKLLEGCGNATRIQCPYHSWTFEKDGALCSTPAQFANAVRNPALEDEDVDGFDAEENSLHAVHAEALGPFVFVSLAADPDPLAEMVTGVSDGLESYDVGGLTLAHTREKELDCNWKVMVSNYLECDHCHANHPDFVRSVDMQEYDIELDEYYSTQRAPILDDERQEVGETCFYFIWPNTTINIYEAGNGCAVYSIDPLSTTQTVLRADYYFEDEDITADREEIIETSYQLQAEDFELVERQFEGLSSGALAQGRLGPNEHAVHHFHRLVESHLTE
ncbi:MULTISPECIES: aromatic ring-hydroxylating dioxygenase subunit alpha [Haloferax]|uniref:Rieske 2Fe-2S domain-containing protein n=1 Tax=Haloferax marinum TaxID=2666143 RepID=A0A6A8GB57_9EURY|nr:MULTISPECIES: SRPBCC family protein [Haloferax]KAB1191244.1 Rieske 2Fe-2S domain-containing protein [Haloferax sp. CBA1150]MRW98137.1 Rieske 2Fe-2S domain-containing protein [Haloferax marinum]